MIHRAMLYELLEEDHILKQSEEFREFNDIPVNVNFPNASGREKILIGGVSAGGMHALGLADWVDGLAQGDVMVLADSAWTLYDFRAEILPVDPGGGLGGGSRPRRGVPRG